jgi:hypothetical protein
MAAGKQILSAALLLFFVFVILSSSYACASGRPAGVYERGTSRSGHHAGVGRAAARNFKAGFLAAKDDSPQKRKLYKATGFIYASPRIDGIASTPDTLASLPPSFTVNLSPVLNL